MCNAKSFFNEGGKYLINTYLSLEHITFIQKKLPDKSFWASNYLYYTCIILPEICPSVSYNNINTENDRFNNLLDYYRNRYMMPVNYRMKTITLFNSVQPLISNSPSTSSLANSAITSEIQASPLNSLFANDTKGVTPVTTNEPVANQRESTGSGTESVSLRCKYIPDDIVTQRLYTKATSITNTASDWSRDGDFVVFATGNKSMDMIVIAGCNENFRSIRTVPIKSKTTTNEEDIFGLTNANGGVECRIDYVLMNFDGSITAVVYDQCTEVIFVKTKNIFYECYKEAQKKRNTVVIEEKLYTKSFDFLIKDTYGSSSSQRSGAYSYALQEKFNEIERKIRECYSLYKSSVSDDTVNPEQNRINVSNINGPKGGTSSNNAATAPLAAQLGTAVALHRRYPSAISIRSQRSSVDLSASKKQVRTEGSGLFSISANSRLRIPESTCKAIMESEKLRTGSIYVDRLINMSDFYSLASSSKVRFECINVKEQTKRLSSSSSTDINACYSPSRLSAERSREISATNSLSETLTINLTNPSQIQKSKSGSYQLNESNFLISDTKCLHAINIDKDEIRNRQRTYYDKYYTKINWVNYNVCVVMKGPKDILLKYDLADATFNEICIKLYNIDFDFHVLNYMTLNNAMIPAGKSSGLTLLRKPVGFIDYLRDKIPTSTVIIPSMTLRTEVPMHVPARNSGFKKITTYAIDTNVECSMYMTELVF